MSVPVVFVAVVHLLFISIVYFHGKIFREPSVKSNSWNGFNVISKPVALDPVATSLVKLYLQAKITAPLNGVFCH